MTFKEFNDRYQFILNDYYRRKEFGLTEYIAHRKSYDVHYFFKNNNLSQDQLKQVMEKHFI